MVGRPLLPVDLCDFAQVHCPVERGPAPDLLARGNRARSSRHPTRNEYAGGSLIADE
jgi:hypothetical protein